MLHPPILITGDDPQRMLNFFLTEKMKFWIEAAERKVRDILVQNAPARPAVTQIFEILTFSMGHLATWKNSEFVSEYLGQNIYIDTVYEDAVDGAGTGLVACGIVRALGDLIRQTADLLQIPDVAAAVPRLRLTLLDPTMAFLSADPDLHPYYTADFLLRLQDALERQQPEKAVQTILELKDGLLAALETQPEPRLDFEDDPFIITFDEDRELVSVENTRRVNAQFKREPDDVILARLQDRQARLQASADDHAIELAWVTFGIRTVETRVRTAANLASCVNITPVPSATVLPFTSKTRPR